MLHICLLPLAGFLLPAVATRIELLPRQTSPAEDRNPQAIVKRAPVETIPPQARWAHMAADELFQRDVVGTDTCGWISAPSSYLALTCGVGYTCTNSGLFRGCCSGSIECSTSTNFYTTCLDSTAEACSGSVGPNTACCTYSTQWPYCVTYLWSTSATPGEVFTEYNCDRTQYSGQYFLAATDPTTSSAAPSTTRSSSSTTATTTSSSSSGTPVVISTPTPTPTSHSSGKSTNTGAIVGGVVGGVVGLALIGVLIWFLVRRNSHNKVDSPQQPMMAQNNYPSPGQPGFDPRYSYATSPGGASGPMGDNSVAYPSPQGSPQPYMQGMGIYNQQSQSSPPQGYYGSQAGGSPPPQHAMQGGYMEEAKPGVPAPHENATEVPATQLIGTEGRRAELM